MRGHATSSVEMFLNLDLCSPSVLQNEVLLSDRIRLRSSYLNMMFPQYASCFASRKVLFNCSQPALKGKLRQKSKFHQL